MPSVLPNQSNAASTRDFAVSLEESLNQLVRLRDQMNGEIDSHLQRLRELRADLETAHQASGLGSGLFESDPDPITSCAIDCASPSPKDKIETRLPVIERSPIDPELEQTTLDELNAALAQAFSQMTGE